MPDEMHLAFFIVSYYGGSEGNKSLDVKGRKDFTMCMGKIAIWTDTARRLGVTAAAIAYALRHK